VIQLDASMLVIMVIFWATYFVARKLIFLPVARLLDERALEIATAQKVYSEALAQSEAELEAQKARLGDALGVARSRRDEVRKEAQARRSEIVAQAKLEAEAELGAAREQLDTTVAEERQKLADLSASLAGQMADRLLRRAS
jgi:F-type H+-transporting ATPase subunit b